MCSAKHRAVAVGGALGLSLVVAPPARASSGAGFSFGLSFGYPACSTAPGCYPVVAPRRVVYVERPVYRARRAYLERPVMVYRRAYRADFFHARHWAPRPPRRYVRRSVWAPSNRHHERYYRRYRRCY